jgi:hypothetical protein
MKEQYPTWRGRVLRGENLRSDKAGRWRAEGGDLQVIRTAAFDADASGEVELKKHITATVERAGRGVRSGPKWRYHVVYGYSI